MTSKNDDMMTQKDSEDLKNDTELAGLLQRSVMELEEIDTDLFWQVLI